MKFFTIKFILFFLILNCYSCNFFKTVLGDKAEVDDDFIDQAREDIQNADFPTEGLLYFYNFNEGQIPYQSAVGGTDWDLNVGNPGNVGFGEGILGSGLNCSYNDAGAINNMLALIENIGTGDFSISFWIKLGTSGATYQGLMGNLDVQDDVGWEVFLAYNGEIELWYSNTDADLNVNFSPSGIVPGKFYHIVITQKRGAAPTLYIDGNFEREGIVTTPLDSSYNLNGEAYGVVFCNIYDSGTAPTYSSSAHSEDNLLDSVGVWNRVLSEDDIKALYNEGNGNEI